MAIKIYADLATLKDSLGLEHPADTADDAQLNKNLLGASRAIDQVTGRRFWVDDAVSARTYRPGTRSVWTDDGEHKLIVDDIATTAGLVVETGTMAAGFTAVTSYETAPDNAVAEGKPITGILLISRCWPSGNGQRARVTSKWGWPAVPDDIEQACLILSRRLFHRKDSPAGVMGSQEWVVNLSRRDPDVQGLIEHFVLPGFG